MINLNDSEKLQPKQSEICIIEPFYGGSHKQLIDLITNELTLLNLKYDIFTMTSKKWYLNDNFRFYVKSN